MTVPFTQIPGTLRVPAFAVEIDPSAAGGGLSARQHVLFGQKMACGTATANAAVSVGSEAEAVTLFGRGSMLHRMFRAFRANNPLGTVLAMPVADAAGTKAAGSIALTGTATAAGTLCVYLGGRLARAGVAVGATAAVVAAALKNVINQYGTELSSGHLTVGTWYEITARDAVTFTTDGAPANTVGTVFCATGSSITLTALDKVKPVTQEYGAFAQVLAGATGTVDIIFAHTGTVGNSFDVRLNYYGAQGGEVTPAGLTATVTTPTGGATDPTLTTAFTNLANVDFFGLAHAWPHDGTAFAAMKTELAARWQYDRAQYGHAFGAINDVYADLITWGGGVNDPHQSIIGLYATPTCTDEVAAAACGAACQALDADPARPVQTLELVGVMAPAVASRFSFAQRQALLSAGVATVTIDAASAVRLDRCITTYQLNGSGVPDTAYLDSETLYTIQAVIERLRSAITSKYPRHKLVSDATPLRPGAAMLNPKAAKTEFIAQYAAMQDLGWVQDLDAFKAALIVEINGTDPSRLDVLFSPVLAGQLRIWAILNQFRLAA